MSFEGKMHHVPDWTTFLAFHLDQRAVTFMSPKVILYLYRWKRETEMIYCSSAHAHTHAHTHAHAYAHTHTLLHTNVLKEIASYPQGDALSESILFGTSNSTDGKNWSEPYEIFSPNIFLSCHAWPCFVCLVLSSFLSPCLPFLSGLVWSGLVWCGLVLSIGWLRWGIVLLYASHLIFPPCWCLAA